GLALLVSIDGQFPEPYTVERATTKVPRFFDFFKKIFQTATLCQSVDISLHSKKILLWRRLTYINDISGFLA
ncbi:MAG: hypothetical protein K2J47_00560, partial [Ruminococcus sp.]|nr:hypothetical protein [Ruminococcus sp.]